MSRNDLNTFLNNQRISINESIYNGIENDNKESLNSRLVTIEDIIHDISSLNDSEVLDYLNHNVENSVDNLVEEYEIQERPTISLSIAHVFTKALVSFLK